MKEVSASALIERVKSEIIPASKVRLLRLILSPSITDEELDLVLSNWNMVTEGATGALLMTYLMDCHPQMNYPDSLYDTLKRRLGFYIRNKFEFQKNCPLIIRELHNHGITVNLFKGGDIFLHKPDLFLEMRDIDVIVERGRWKEAARLISNLGYDIVNWDNHSFDAHIKGDYHGLIDIHRYLPPMSGKKSRIMKDVLSRAVDCELWGAPCRTLCPEDLVFTYLGNIYRNIVSCRRPQSIPCNIFHIGIVLGSNSGFDWKIVVEDAERAGVSENISFVASFVNSVIPGLLPDDIFLSRDNLESISCTVAFERYIMCYLQGKSHCLPFRSVLSGPKQVINILKIRPLYTSMKMFRNYSGFAKMVLFIVRKMKLFSL